VASRLAELALFDLPPDYFDDYRDRILAVDAEAVHRAARERIRPAELSIVIAGDAAAIRGPVEALSLGPVEVVGVGDLP
jgi:predicted Zn-dependent peptidase